MPDEIQSPADPVPYLVVGLGNPGEEYAHTPHNLGFMVIDRLAETHEIRVTRKEEMARVGPGAIGAKRVVLAKPQTFMNASGASVKGLVSRYGVEQGHLVVVYDELDLPWESVRIRLRGSAAGHNGVKSLISSLGTDEFVRVRLGIHRPGRERAAGEGAKFVLGPFKRHQMKEVEEVVARAAEAVESILAEGAEQAMAKFNAHRL